MSHGAYKTVLRRTGHGWLAIRMFHGQELFRSQGLTRDKARDNLKNYESHRKADDSLIHRIPKLFC